MGIVEATASANHERFALASIVCGVASIVAFVLIKDRSAFPVLPAAFSLVGYVCGAIALFRQSARWGGAIGIALSSVAPGFVLFVLAYMKGWL